MPPSSRSASSRPSLSSTRSTPPTDVGESNKNKMPIPKAEDKAGESSSSSSSSSSPTEAEDIPSAPPEEIALPSEQSHDTLLETTSKDDSEIDAIFEQSASDSESACRPPSIPDYHYTGPRNYSRLTARESEDERSGTPPPNPFGPSIRSATLRTAQHVAGDNGAVMPDDVCESPSPFVSRSRMSSVVTSRGGAKHSAFSEAPIFSPFSSQKKKKNGKNGFSRGMQSPSRKGGRLLEIPVAPSPDPSPLVLLHVTLLPLPIQGPASSVLANHLRRMISPTIVARGLLLPHPNDDYDALLEMVAENLGLDQETPPPFRKAATYAADDCASHSEGSYMSSSEEDVEAFCPSCSRRRLKPEFARHDRPRRHRRPFNHTEKWYTINVFASNGLMRAGAWSRSWEEMERVDVEVTVTSGYEDIEPVKPIRPSSQRSEGKRTLQGSFHFKRRLPPVGIETTTDEEMPKPRRTSAGRRRPSGPRVLSGSIRSRNSSSYMKQEPLSELEILPDTDNTKDIYEEGLDTDIPIFEPPKEEDVDFVPIWEDKDTKEGKETKPPIERMRSEDAWTTDEESAQKGSAENENKSPSPEDTTSDETEDENRRLSAFTMDTAIHHTIAGSSRETSVESDARSLNGVASPEPDVVPTPSPSPAERKVSNPHRLHPSSRRGSREINLNEFNYAASEKTASRPTSSRAPNSMVIVGLAISDDSDNVLEDSEEDKENQHDSIDNKENIPVDISDDDEPERPQYPADDEDPEELKPTPTPQRNRRAVTPKTAGPSPMPSRFSSPAISPDISPMVSRAGSPQPAKESVSRERRRRRSTRKSFSRSFDSKSSPTSRGHSRHNSSTSHTASAPPREESPRGRSISRSPRPSPSPSPSPLEKELISGTMLDKLRLMIKPTIDTISAIPLPTLLLIAIPFAGLIAFSVNSYVQQKNLDFMLRNFMESQIAREMQILQQQQQVVKHVQPAPIEVATYGPAPPSVVKQVVAEAEKVLVAPVLTAEEQAELDWREAQKKGLDHESVVYGIQVGGKCVMPQDVADAIRKAAKERDETEQRSQHQSDEQEVPDALDAEEETEDINFANIQAEGEGESDNAKVDEEDEVPEAAPQSPVLVPEEKRGRENNDRSQDEEEQYRYERAGSRSPPIAPYRQPRERSRERKNVPQQPYDYYHQPPNVIDDYYDSSRLSDAGDIDVGKMDVRDGGLEDTWYRQEIPEMMLPPPIREVPASPSKVQQIPSPEPSQDPEAQMVIKPADSVSTSPYQDAEEPQHTSTEQVEAEQSVVPSLPSLRMRPDLHEEKANVPEEKPEVPQPDAVEPEQMVQEHSSRPPSRNSGSPKQQPQEADSKPATMDGAVSQEQDEQPPSRPVSSHGEPVAEPEEQPSRPVSRTGYTPQQRPQDYHSRPPSRNNVGIEEEEVEEEEEDSRPPMRDGSSNTAEIPSRPPTRNGRANSRPPTASRAGSRSRPSSRSGSKSRSRSRSRHTAEVKSSTSSVELVQEVETETTQEHVPQETEVPTYGPLNLQPVVEESVPIKAEEAPAVASWRDELFQKLNLRFGQQRVIAAEEAIPSTAAPIAGTTATAKGNAEDVKSSTASAELVLESLFPASESGDEEYEDAESEPYDDSQIEQQLQQTTDRYEDYAYDDDADATDEDGYIPEDLLQEEYVFDDEEDTVGYGDADEFDYEGFKDSLKESWQEEEK
ncbi:hypothetical protein ABW20_dc0100922 [Dactylellina cionopaga]|nr:hypothetical protein ABW20_dc0100922 [Dactylellina cionopaga]